DQRLEQLQQRLEQQLQPLAGRPYFVFHDAYGYLEDSVGLRPRGVFSLSAEIQPGAQHVQRLRATLTDAGSSCIFREPQFPTERIAALISGLSVRTADLVSLGIGVPVDANGYEALLTQLGDNLGACLQDLCLPPRWQRVPNMAASGPGKRLSISSARREFMRVVPTA